MKKLRVQSEIVCELNSEAFSVPAKNLQKNSNVLSAESFQVRRRSTQDRVEVNALLLEFLPYISLLTKV